MKVLLSTDLQSTRDVHYQLLESLGVESITEADDVEAAVACQRSDAFDFVLCAMTHSDESLNVIDAIRRCDKNIPIILVVDGHDRSTVVAAIRSGCSDYLLSPVSKAALAGKLEKWAGSGVDRMTTRSSEVAELVGSACCV